MCLGEFISYACTNSPLTLSAHFPPLTSAEIRTLPLCNIHMLFQHVHILLEEASGSRVNEEIQFCRLLSTGLDLLLGNGTAALPLLYSDFTYSPEQLAAWAVLLPSDGYEVCVPFEGIGQAMNAVRGPT
jgi:hypothetical protein